MKEEINFIMRYKPSFILVDHQQKDEGIQHIYKYFVDKKGFEKDVVRSLVMKYPYILGKSEKHLDQYFALLGSKGISEVVAMRQLLECPKLISVNLEEQMKEIFFLMNLYNGLSEEDVLSIFQRFPYLFCCEIDKVRRFMGEFKKYRFTKFEIVKVLQQSGGILASKVGTMIALFDYLRVHHDIKASDVKDIIA